MTKKKKKSGKELAKINKRKKFYEKLERYYQRAKDEVIFISMNKNLSFPEFDELSKMMENSFEEMDKKVDIEKSKSIDIIYMEEVHFLMEAGKKKQLAILRRETMYNNEGDLRKGVQSQDDDDSYDYQKAYNWGFKLSENQKFAQSLAKEKDDPTEYDLTKPKAKVTETFYYKARKTPRRRR